MLRKRYYILFVARDDDGQIRKIPLPLHYAYGFVAAAVVGAFTIVGLAGSYTRMLVKTESYNQVRQERETLRKDYNQMAQIAHDRTVQVASLGALANEVSALYGLRQNRLAAPKHSAAEIAAAPTPASLAQSDNPTPQQIDRSIADLSALRAEALSGQISRALQGGLSPTFGGDWTELADAPSFGRLRAAWPPALACARTRSMGKALSTPASTLTRPSAHRCGPRATGMWKMRAWLPDTAEKLSLTMATV